MFHRLKVHFAKVQLDVDERIILANDAFAQATGESAANLQGRIVSRMNWITKDDGKTRDLPWIEAVRRGETTKNLSVRLKGVSKNIRTFMVNATPILGGDGRHRGAMVTFDDVTGLEEKNAQLENMLRQLETSRAKVKRQNEELRLLATQDPLTQCLNRRAFLTN